MKIRPASCSSSVAVAASSAEASSELDWPLPTSLDVPVASDESEQASPSGTIARTSAAERAVRDCIAEAYTAGSGDAAPNSPKATPPSNVLTHPTT